MKPNPDKQQLVDRFLNGAMNAQELDEFTRALEVDEELRSMFDAASGTEALLHATLPEVQSTLPFESMVKEAIASETVSPRLIPFPWLRAYALAATFIICIMGGYIASMQGATHRNQQTQSAADTVKSIQINDKTPQGKSIMRLTSSTLFLAEEGSKIRIIHGEDSAVNVVLSQGNTCFDVSGKEMKPIVVATPHAAITLYGSVTRIVVTELETEVAVLEGHAEIVHRYDAVTKRALVAGSAIYADLTTLQTADALTPDVCKSRKSMFRAYVAWVQQQAHG